MNGKQLATQWAHDKCTDDDLSFILNDAVFYEITQALGVPPHDRSNLALWEAVNFTRLGHARGLLDFFEHERKNAFPDDVLAEDYGFARRSINLPQEDRVRLNKDLFHMTFARCRHRGGATKGWPKSILEPIHACCLDFCEHVLSPKLRKGIMADVPRWKSLTAALQSGRELKLEFSLESDWRLSASARPLLNGRSRLTDWETTSVNACATGANAVSTVNSYKLLGPNVGPA